MCLYTDGFVGGLALSKVSLFGRKNVFRVHSSWRWKCLRPSYTIHAIVHHTHQGRDTGLFSWLLYPITCESRFGSHLSWPSFQIIKALDTLVKPVFLCFPFIFKPESSKKLEALHLGRLLVNPYIVHVHLCLLLLLEEKNTMLKFRLPL